MTERVDDLSEPPVVGRFYLVPCVRGRWNGRLGNWPVWGPKHDDAEHIGFIYHLDRRFLPEGMVYLARTAPISDFRQVFGYRENDPLPPPVYRRKKCRRSVDEFPRERAEMDANFNDFYQAFEGRACKRDGDMLICPHKGMRLSPLEADEEGVIMCPLHGLLINARTGIVVMRDEKQGRLPL